MTDALWRTLRERPYEPDRMVMSPKMADALSVGLLINEANDAIRDQFDKRLWRTVPNLPTRFRPLARRRVLREHRQMLADELSVQLFGEVRRTSTFRNTGNGGE